MKLTSKSFISVCPANGRCGGFSLLEFAILMVIFGAIAAATTMVGDKWIEKEE